jgi:hypothetical protein
MENLDRLLTVYKESTNSPEKRERTVQDQDIEKNISQASLP